MRCNDHVFVCSQDHPAFWALRPWPMGSLVAPSQVRRGRALAQVLAKGHGRDRDPSEGSLYSRRGKLRCCSLHALCTPSYNVCARRRILPCCVEMRRTGVEIAEPAWTWAGKARPTLVARWCWPGLGVGPRSVGHSIYDEVGTEIVVFSANDAG